MPRPKKRILINGAVVLQIQSSQINKQHCCSPADPRQFSSALTEDEKGRPLDVAPPVFTHGTKISKRKQVANVGDTFKVSCEALGSPQPEIFWFKDGQHIDEPVHYKRGKSTVEFAVMGTADSGVYTCR